ncbi:MAG: LysR family transcriptional regulator [Pseudomonadota bacterium]
MDPKHLVYLAEIVKFGSMSRAARRLNVGQPTLSRIVKIIEDRVGAPVLRRGRYGVTPTAVGERLAAQGREIAANTAQAMDWIDQWKKGLTGEVRLGVGSLLAATVMGGFFEAPIRQSWPYAIKVVSAYAARAIDAMNEGTLDAAILPSRLDLAQENLTQEQLFRDRLAIFASADNPLANAGRRLGVEDLRHASWIETAAISGIHGAMRDILAEHGLDDHLHRLHFSGDFVMAYQVIARSNALCILPERQLAQTSLVPKLAKLDVDIALPTRDVAFWTTRASRDAAEVRHLHGQLVAYFQRLGLHTVSQRG